MRNNNTYHPHTLSDGTRVGGAQGSGYRYAPPDPNCKSYVGGQHVSHLPRKVDLRRLMTPVENQGGTSSCVGNAVAGAYEYLVKRHLGADGYDVSRMFIYYNARYEDNPKLIEDKGTFIRAAIKGLETYGACSETTWAFDESRVDEVPPDEAYEEAAKFCIEDCYVVPTNLETWKTALSEGHPIIFAINTYDSFDYPMRGRISVPSQQEVATKKPGGHAMLCVGYSDPDEVFIVRNSWGPGWGSEGYCYIPYQYMMDSKFNAGDNWIIERVNVLPPDEKTWADDEETVLEDVSEFLGDMDKETYAKFMGRMGSVPLEARLSLLFLRAARADGNVAEEELEAMAGYLTPVLKKVGSNVEARTVLNNTKQYFLDDQDLIDETLEIFGEEFNQEVKATITNQLQEIVSSDGEVSSEEQEWVNDLVQNWQVEVEGGDEEGEDEEKGGEEDDGEEGDGEEGEGEEEAEEEEAEAGAEEEEAEEAEEEEEAGEDAEEEEAEEDAEEEEAEEEAEEEGGEEDEQAYEEDVEEE